MTHAENLRIRRNQRTSRKTLTLTHKRSLTFRLQLDGKYSTDFAYVRLCLQHQIFTAKLNSSFQKTKYFAASKYRCLMLTLLSL